MKQKANLTLYCTQCKLQVKTLYPVVKVETNLFDAVTSKHNISLFMYAASIFPAQ